MQKEDYNSEGTIQGQEVKAETSVNDDQVLTDDAQIMDEVNIDEPTNEIETLKNLLQEREEALEKEKKEYLFLMADFDNFKKRTLREKAEILKNGGESTLKGLLPILDDFERGLSAIKDTSDAEAVKAGMELIYNKFVKFLEQNGVKEIETTDAPFNDEYHEAIAMVPVDDDTKKGHVIDTLTKGYTLNGKVIRHAKVAVGQ